MTTSGRCGRPTRRGAACTLPAVLVAPSCINHLTDEERAEHERHKAEPSPFDVRRDPDKPACWTWPIRTVEALIESACEGLTERTRESILTPPHGELVLSMWQDGRCAICGHHKGEQLVLDHDHATNLIRGYLCRSCNTREGSEPGGVFALYRERNPASILGVRDEYWHPDAPPVRNLSAPRSLPTSREKVKRTNPAVGIGL